MMDVQFSYHEMQVLSEPSVCNTPTQKPSVRELQSQRPVYISHF